MCGSQAAAQQLLHLGCRGGFGIGQSLPMPPHQHVLTTLHPLLISSMVWANAVASALVPWHLLSPLWRSQSTREHPSQGMSLFCPPHCVALTSLGVKVPVSPLWPSTPPCPHLLPPPPCSSRQTRLPLNPLSSFLPRVFLFLPLHFLFVQSSAQPAPLFSGPCSTLIPLRGSP